jgi:hypothetical protein
MPDREGKTDASRRSQNPRVIATGAEDARVSAKQVDCSVSTVLINGESRETRVQKQVQVLETAP